MAEVSGKSCFREAYANGISTLLDFNAKYTEEGKVLDPNFKIP